MIWDGEKEVGGVEAIVITLEPLNYRMTLIFCSGYLHNPMSILCTSCARYVLLNLT